MNRLFERIIKEYSNVTVLNNDPYVLILHNFFTPIEKETILKYALPNIKRSTDQGIINEHGIREQVVS